MTKDDLNVMQLADILTMALSVDDLMDIIDKQRKEISGIIDECVKVKAELQQLQDVYQKTRNQEINLKLEIIRLKDEITILNNTLFNEMSRVAEYEDSENDKKDT